MCVCVGGGGGGRLRSKNKDMYYRWRNHFPKISLGGGGGGGRNSSYFVALKQAVVAKQLCFSVICSFKKSCFDQNARDFSDPFQVLKKTYLWILVKSSSFAF